MEIKLTTGKKIETAVGQNMLEALKAGGVYLVSPCGGKGTCGKCRVKVLEGTSKVSSSGKLSKKEREEGLQLACQTIISGDMTIEIPESSRLVVGDKIALSRAEDLEKLLAEMGATVEPLIKRVILELPPPTIEDSISDVERLKRALSEKGLDGMHFSHDFATSVAKNLRDAGWNASLYYTDGAEGLFVAPAGEEKSYAIAVDIGTTTVVVYLVDTAEGRLVDVGSTYNSQMRFGDDVITRIVHATEGGGLGDLRDTVVQDINNLLKAMLERHGILDREVRSLAVSGNTTMTQIFWGLDPGYIREEPYIPTLNYYPVWKAGASHVKINQQAPVYTLPCVASYVGGDIVSGVLATGMHRKEEIALFMDIGTNGEIALGNNEWMVTAACSAGPCFEGSGIKHGMRATEGAIESVSIDRDTLEPEVGVVGGTAPVGICGSGMLDALAELFLSGLIDQKGKFVREAPTWRVRKGDEGMEYVFCRGNEDCGQDDIVLTEVDIENIIRAKAAIYAGVSLLVKEVGFTLDAVERVYIAGGFGNYLNVEKAIIIGMLPDMPKEKFSFRGNTSIAGAYLTLLSEKMRREAEDLASRMTYMELSVSRGFMDEYMSSLFLPHTDLGQFPTVAAMLDK